jgi:hypothetical protein
MNHKIFITIQKKIFYFFLNYNHTKLKFFLNLTFDCLKKHIFF